MFNKSIFLSFIIILYMHGVSITDITRLFIQMKSEFEEQQRNDVYVEAVVTEETYAEITEITEIIPITEAVVTSEEIITEPIVTTEEVTIPSSVITTPPDTCPLSDYELRLFANVVDLEFNPDVSYDGAVITAIVIYNRIRSGTFPNTVEGVLYQSGQFSCIGSVTGNASDTAIQIVKDIYNGNYHGYDWLVDNGLYFCNQWCDFSSWATLVHEHWSGNYCVKVYR